MNAKQNYRAAKVRAIATGGYPDAELVNGQMIYAIHATRPDNSAVTCGGTGWPAMMLSAAAHFRRRGLRDAARARIKEVRWVRVARSRNA